MAGGCVGTEPNLLSCPRNPLQTGCSLSQLAGVQCSVPCELFYFVMFMRDQLCFVFFVSLFFVFFLLLLCYHVACMQMFMCNIICFSSDTTERTNRYMRDLKNVFF